MLWCRTWQKTLSRRLYFRIRRSGWEGRVENTPPFLLQNFARSKIIFPDNHIKVEDTDFRTEI
jgi:hypothetical protein